MTEGSRHDDGAAVASWLVDADEDRSGVILLRAWLHEGQVVARIHSSVPGQQEQQSGVAVGIGEIERTVHEWLRNLAMTQP